MGEEDWLTAWGRRRDKPMTRGKAEGCGLPCPLQTPVFCLPVFGKVTAIKEGWAADNPEALGFISCLLEAWRAGCLSL